MNKLILKKFEQVAFYASSIRDAKNYYARLGIFDWTEDTVTAEGFLYSPQLEEPTPITCVADLAFNYDLGFELELLHYKAGQNWHWSRRRIQSNGQSELGMFASHMAYHVEDLDYEVRRLQASGLYLCQLVNTISHTNEYLLKTGRRYRYAIFDSRETLGFDLKLIQRVERETQEKLAI